MTAENLNIESEVFIENFEFEASTTRRRSRGRIPDSNPMRSSLTATDYFKLLNIETAKFISIVLVVGFGAYHGILGPKL